MTSRRLELSRSEVLGFRRRVQALDERLPPGPESLRRAAWAGLADSMPRAAILSIHARVAGTAPTVLDDPSLVQLWGPRFSAYVVAARDLAVFSRGRLPSAGPGRQRAEDLAEQLDAFLAGRRLSYAAAGAGLGVHPNRLRYAAQTGRVVMRWDGARAPEIWTVPAPEIDPLAARVELASRYLHVFGIATPATFARWAGISAPDARAAFQALGAAVTPARTPAGEGWILAADEPLFEAEPSPPAPARLLPSGDTYVLLHGADRALLVPDADRRGDLWTPRVWPGAVLVAGEIAGTWRRADAVVTVQPWRALSGGERDAVEAEAAALPLPGIAPPVRVRWEA
jgi:hypothetical protein